MISIYEIALAAREELVRARDARRCAEIIMRELMHALDDRPRSERIDILAHLVTECIWRGIREEIGEAEQ